VTEESTNRLDTTSRGDAPCTKPEQCHRGYKALVQLYVLAETLQDVKAKNSAVDAIVSKIPKESSLVNKRLNRLCLPSPDAIDSMYRSTSDYCTGRQMLIDCFV
jgi:hypothetical protein